MKIDAAGGGQLVGQLNGGSTQQCRPHGPGATTHDAPRCSCAGPGCVRLSASGGHGPTGADPSIFEQLSFRTNGTIEALRPTAPPRCAAQEYLVLFLGATLSVCMLLLTGLKVSKEDLQKILDGNPAPGPRHCHQHWGHAR